MPLQPALVSEFMTHEALAFARRHAWRLAALHAQFPSESLARALREVRQWQADLERRAVLDEKR